MSAPRCRYCKLPVRIHFAWCQESAIIGNMPKEAMTPNAIIFDPGELRLPRLSDWKVKHGKRNDGH